MILGGAISSERLLVRLFLLILPATSRPSLGRSSINRPAVAEVGFSRIPTFTAVVANDGFVPPLPRAYGHRS